MEKYPEEPEEPYISIDQGFLLPDIISNDKYIINAGYKNEPSTQIFVKRKGFLEEQVINLMDH